MQNKIQINQQQIDLLEAALGKVLISEGCPTAAEISLVFCDNQQIRELNKQYRGKDYPTDVLSFTMYDSLSAVQAEEAEGYMLGDIVISLEKVASQAIEYGHSFNRELVYLAVHSILHLLGYDHETEAERKVMREKEEKILSEMQLLR